MNLNVNNPKNWIDLLDRVLRLKPQYSIHFYEDLYWLFAYDLLQEINQQGFSASPFYRRLPESKLIGAEWVMPTENLQRVSILGDTHRLQYVYSCGMDSQSGMRLHFNSTQDIEFNVKEFNQPSPLRVGNFAFVLDDEHLDSSIILPEQLNCIGVAKFKPYATRFVYAWLGVSLKYVDYPLPDKQVIVPPEPYYYIYGSQFMRYYANGNYAQDENELRAKHGFPPKGTRGTGELILYQTVCQIFQGVTVKRRYRGKELNGYEIDIWLPEYRLGFEYQGEQHYKEVKHWHGENGFAEQKRRDKAKKQLFKKLGYTVLYFNKKSDLSHAGVLRELRQQMLLIPRDEYFE